MIGATFKADQHLRIHQIAFFTIVTADISRFNRCGSTGCGAETAKTAFYFTYKRSMINSAGSDNNHTVGAILFVDVGAQIIRSEGLYCFRRAENRAAKLLVEVSGFGKTVENNIIGRIMCRADFLHDHVFLALKLIFVKF